MSTLAGLPGYSAPTQPHEGDKYSSGRLSMYFAEVGSCQVCPFPPTTRPRTDAAPARIQVPRTSDGRRAVLEGRRQGDADHEGGTTQDCHSGTVRDQLGYQLGQAVAEYVYGWFC